MRIVLPALLLLSAASSLIAQTQGMYPSAFYAQGPTGNFVPISITTAGAMLTLGGQGSSPGPNVPAPRGFYPTAVYAQNPAGAFVPVQVDATGALIISGGLTSFTANTLSPIFTTSLGANPTTAPVLTFALTPTTQNFVLAGPISGTGVPSYRLLVPGDIPTINVAQLPVNINPTGLLAYDFFDANDYAGGTGTTAFDKSGNGNNCSIGLGSQLTWSQVAAGYALNWATAITSNSTQMVNCTGITTPYAVSLIFKSTAATGVGYFLGYSTGTANWTVYSQAQASTYPSWAINVSGGVSSATLPTTYNMLTFNLTPTFGAGNTVYQGAQSMPSLNPAYYGNPAPTGGFLKIGGLATSLAPTGASAANMSLVGFIVYGTPGVSAAQVQQNYAVATEYFARRGIDITQQPPRLNVQQSYNVTASGSSIDAGFGSTPPSTFMALGSAYTVNSAAVSSSGTVSRDLSLASTELYNTNPRAGRNILFIGAPTNDMCEGPIYLSSGNSNPALSWAGMLSLADKALRPRIPGAKAYDLVILGTMISRTGNATYTSPPTCEVAKALYNNIARSATLPPGIVLGDVAAIPGLGADGANSGTVGTITPVCPGATTYFINDCVHPNTAGSTLYGLGMQSLILANTGYTRGFPNVQSGTTYTMTAADRAVLAAPAMAAAATYTLPACQALTTYEYTVHNASGFGVTMAPAGSDTIIGSTAIPTLSSGSYRVMLASTVTAGCYWLRQ